MSIIDQCPVCGSDDIVWQLSSETLSGLASGATTIEALVGSGEITLWCWDCEMNHDVV